MGVGEDDMNQDDNKSDSESDLQKSIANSSPESLNENDCLMCSDTEDAAIKSAHKKLPKNVWASCSPTKQGLWKDAQLEQIGNICKTLWESAYEDIKTEQDLALDRDPSSFKMSAIIGHRNQLLQIKVATNVRNIYPWEHKANVNWRKKALVQSLK